MGELTQGIMNAWIEFVVGSAIENNTFDGTVKWMAAYQEAKDQLNCSEDVLLNAFDVASQLVHAEAI